MIFSGDQPVVSGRRVIDGQPLKLIDGPRMRESVFLSFVTKGPCVDEP